MQFGGITWAVRRTSLPEASDLLRLAFSPELEARFRADKSAHRAALIQRAAGLGVLFAWGLLAADHFLIPDVLDWSLALKGLLFPLFCVVGQWVLLRWASPVWREWGVVFTGLLAAGICAALPVASQSVWAVESLVVLNIIVMFVNAIARFLPALIMCLGIVLIHALAVSHMGLVTHPVAVSASLLLTSTAVFTLYGAWVLERDERKAYLLEQQESALQQALTQSHEAVARTARTDALTQLANRRHFDEVLKQVWADAQSRRTGVAILLLDVDHFKAYNDLYGHPAGDACLKAVAQAMAPCVRKGGDVMARWGGEEFAVVMSGASMEAARLLAERIRQAVLELQLPHPGSGCADVVTVSIGVSAMEPGALSQLSELIRTADLCLYEAKGRGRNRVWAREADPYESPPARSSGEIA